MQVVAEKSEINKRRLSIGLYINYFIHGFGLIILAQNMKELSGVWNTPLATVSYVISGVGIGRLLAYLITGFLADKISRKFFVYLGMICYLLFAIGILLSPSPQIGYIFAILAGVANSALDAGTYTTLVEMNDGKGQGTILIKAFMSAGEFILPLIVASLETNSLWFGWSFICMAALIVLNAINLFSLKFPKANIDQVTSNSVGHDLSKARKTILTLALVLYGYTSMALMILYTQWISLYAQNELNLGNVTAHFILSLYSIGSIVGVLVLYALLKHNAKESILLITLNFLALVALVMMMITKNTTFIFFASLLFGFSAAGGVMQTGLTLFMKVYPQMKGMITGVFYFFGSIASFTIPIITGWLSKKSITAAFSFNIIIGIISLGLVIIMWTAIRQRKEDK